MWKATAAEDGSTGLWEASICAGSFSESLSMPMGESAAITAEGSEYVLSIAGVEVARHSTLASCMKQGQRIDRDRSRRVEKGAFELSGLSRSRWHYRFGTFEGIEDPLETIAVRAADDWVPAVGSIELGRAFGGREAQRLLDETPHLSFTTLFELEHAYAGGGGLMDRSVLDRLKGEGLVDLDADGRSILTDEGRRLLDSDPRVLPTAVQDIVFRHVLSLIEREPGLTETVPVRVSTIEDARLAFAHYLSVAIGQQEPRRLLDALRNGADLRYEVERSESRRNLVVALLSDGSEGVRRTVLVLAPDEVGDGSALLAGAIVEAREQVVAWLSRGEQVSANRSSVG